MITRPATPADLRAIADLEGRAWWRAYQDILDPVEMLALDTDYRMARWQSQIDAGEVRAFVAELGDAIVGAAWIGTSREADSPAEEGELRAIHVDPHAQGAGVGKLLMDVALQALRDDGYSLAVLRVLEDNGYARAFYEGIGWTLVAGSSRIDELPQPMVIYRRAL